MTCAGGGWGSAESPPATGRRKKRQTQLGAEVYTATPAAGARPATPAPAPAPPPRAEAGRKRRDRRTRITSDPYVPPGKAAPTRSPRDTSLSNPVWPMEDPGPARATGQPAVVTSSEAARGRLRGWLVTFDWGSAGQSFAVRQGRTVVGSGAWCEAAVPDRSMASEHFTVTASEGACFVRDIGGGTTLNGKGISDEAVLSDGDQIAAAGTTFAFRTVPPVGAGT